ncbi:acyl-CoA dehydrogenase family protein [Fulvivirgaceae bacterium BMA10]|uniref:Acyl-CoA dehydrogenase family protein n=1 Tax=Splendidivirga corallicola TaxID=3051826 RepID=A0ABT8KK08_9BACT|nr:acyl-CoA dehydrogenase family protein [Fulvivirgaceae bacterium BMA10]
MQPWQDPTIEETRKKYKQFAQEHLEGDWKQRDDNLEFSAERWRKCAEFGAFGLSMKKAYGGQGFSYSHTIAALEGLCEGCHDTGFFFAMASQISGTQLTLQALASEQLKQKYLPDLISGKHLSSLGFSEMEAGSDIYSIETTATKADGGFILNGSKAFITNSLDATCCLVFAKTADNRSPFDFTAFMVDLDWDGVSHGEPFEKSTLRTCSLGRIDFKDVFVPDEHIVGGVGGGLNVIKVSIGWERILLMGVCIGPMARVLPETIQRTKDRQQFGRPIGKFQQMSSKIADMVMRYKVSRKVIYDLAGQLSSDDSMGNHLEDVAIAKLYVTENYIQFMLDATQIWGGRGVCKEFSIQQDMRDSLSSTIWAGTSETLRNTIAKLSGTG